MIKLTINVTDIAAVMLLYSHIRIYTSDSESGTYTYLDDVLLVADQSTYYYNHTAGTANTWYKVSYYNMTTEAESSLSDAVNGEYPVLYHTATYPEEYEFTATEKILIRKIRRYIGDLKGLDKMYMSSSDSEFCSSIQNDGKTIEFGKGWPVYISLNGVEKTSSSDPVIQGYMWASFSGTIGDDNYPISMWYYTFKFSDVEIYRAYDDAQMPPYITSSNVNVDMMILQASIDLLESMWAEDSVEDGADLRDDQSLYSPRPGLSERSKIIDNLKKRSVGGVLID